MPRGQLTTEDRLRIQVKRLKNINKKYKARIIKLEKRVSEQDKIIETLRLQIEELQRLIFGKGRRPAPQDEYEFEYSDKEKAQTKQRSPESYRRPIPKENEISSIKRYSIKACPDCGTKLKHKRQHIRFQIDIVLPATCKEQTKQTEKQTIEAGFCPKCKRRKHAIPVSPQICTIGPNTKTFIHYCNYVLRLSFSQTQTILKSMHKFSISKGEIALILEQGAEKLQPEYNNLIKTIRGSPGVNLDETSWQELAARNYVWIMTPSIKNESAVFRIGSRGRANAEQLLGKDFSGVRITDGYGVYKNLPGDRQLCWVHLLRNARDIAQSQILPNKRQAVCISFYQRLKNLYKQVKVSQPKHVPCLNRKLNYLLHSNKEYPQKLINLQERLKTHRHALFTCVSNKNIPSHNNKAEQKLRHIVLKRKTSFGTKSAKGSQIFAINASVILSLWWQNPENCLLKMHKLLNA